MIRRRPDSITEKNSLLKDEAAVKTAKILLIIFGVMTLLYIGALPVRGYLSQRYIQRGDELLLQKKYLSAELEYEKAILLKPKTALAHDRIHLIDQVAADISKLKPLLAEKAKAQELMELSAAYEVPQDETAAVKLSKKMIESGEYQLAIVPAQTATEMDPGYRDAWLYLGIANYKTAKGLELKDNQRSQYLTAAREALDQAAALDPLYEPTQKYLAELAR